MKIHQTYDNMNQYKTPYELLFYIQNKIKNGKYVLTNKILKEIKIVINIWLRSTKSFKQINEVLKRAVLESEYVQTICDLVQIIMYYAPKQLYGYYFSYLLQPINIKQYVNEYHSRAYRRNGNIFLTKWPNHHSQPSAVERLIELVSVVTKKIDISHYEIKPHSFQNCRQLQLALISFHQLTDFILILCYFILI